MEQAPEHPESTISARLWVTKAPEWMSHSEAAGVHPWEWIIHSEE